MIDSDKLLRCSFNWQTKLCLFLARIKKGTTTYLILLYTGSSVAFHAGVFRGVSRISSLTTNAFCGKGRNTTPLKTLTWGASNSVISLRKQPLSVDPRDGGCI